MSSAGFIAIPVLIGVLFLMSIALAIYRRRRGSRPGDRVTASQAQYRKNLQERDENLKREVEKRKAEEQITNNGTPVWFSRHVKYGDLRHWALIIDGSKYELRRDELARGGYSFKITVDPHWSARQARSEGNRLLTHIRESDGFVLCLIGWTSLSATRLNEISDTIMSKFNYNLLWNNCQDFLQDLADQCIAPDKRALDWPWFREHAKTEYQLQQKVPPAPEVIIARMAASMQASQNSQNQQNQQIQNNYLVQLQLQQQQSAAVMNMAIMQPPPAAPPPAVMGFGGGAGC